MGLNHSFQLHYDHTQYFHLIGGGNETVTANYYWDCRQRTGNYCLFQYTIKGQGHLQIGDSHYTLKPGDAFLATIPGNQIYSLAPDSINWQFIYLEFSPHFIDQWHQMTQDTPILNFKEHPVFVKNCLALNQIGLQNTFSDYFENTSRSAQFFFDLLRISQHTHQSAQDKYPEWLSHYRQWLDIHYDQDISLEDATDIFNKSKYTLIKVFKYYYQQSPKQYLIDLRIKKAMRLLIEHPELTVKTVAQKCGFQSANYFTKVFHKKTMYSPLKFAKENTLHDSSVHYFNN